MGDIYYEWITGKKEERMNREEAIEFANEWLKTIDENEKDSLTYEFLTYVIHELQQEPCEDAISRQAVLNAIAANCIRENEYNLTSSRIKNAVEQLPSVSTEKTDDYKQGWHDAIKKALKEAYTIHHYGDIFRVVQEETLIGVDMAYEQEPKTEPNRCNQCKYYEGVHNVQGHAPCSFLKCGGVLWDWHCSNYEPTGAESEVEE